jgi:hypothetical protein
MTPPFRRRRVRDLFAAELRHLATFNRSERKWHMPVAAALASGLPLLVGAAFDQLPAGLVASIGGLVFLYLPATPLHHRMAWPMACAFGLIGSYALGTVAHVFFPLAVPVLTFLAIAATMVCRFYAFGPPASLFFVMAASIGLYTPVTAALVPQRVGLFALGSLLACLIGLVYSLLLLRVQPPRPVPRLPAPSFDFVVFDAVVIGGCVGLSLAIAQLLGLQRPYWVPVSCLAVIQGVSLRAVWNRQLQRIGGTAVGMLLAWGLLSLPLDRWTVPLMIIALTLVVESLVVRHYGLAVVFITPMAILLAEAAQLGAIPAAQIVQARFVDTVLGCLVGLAGGVALHSPRFRAVAGGWLRRLVPQRLARNNVNRS